MNFLFSLVSYASYEEQKYVSYTLCRNQKQVRTIRIEKDKAGFWVAYYTKLGVDQQVARAQNMDSSEKVTENIKENLIKASWKCKDIQNVNSTANAGNVANNGQ